MMQTSTLKHEFGKRFRAAREDHKLSRAALAVRLGISPKTIQSWEMGRTFIENLSLIPAIEAELNTTFAELLGQVESGAAQKVAEAPPPYGATAKPSDRAAAGPLRPVFAIAGEMDKKTLEAKEAEYLAAPLLKPGSANKDVAELLQKDIKNYVLFPRQWATRGRVLVAYRMADSALTPAVPQGSHVLVDRRTTSAKRLEGRFAALWLADRGMRLRQIELDPDGAVHGVPYGSNTRGAVAVRPDRGDEILGKVLGFVSPVD
jgi:transcriptional regulator with XRE-family HTH domain